MPPPGTPSQDSTIKALAVAVELLSRQIADLPLALARNAGKSTEQITAELHAQGKSAYDTLGFGRDEGFGGNRVRSGSPDLNGSGGVDWQKQLNRLSKGAQMAGDAVLPLAGAFGRVLGPLTTFTTFLTANASGSQVFNQAISVLANSVGRIAMPAFYAMSVGVIGAADKINNRLAPAMEGWNRLILGTAIPAMQQFADVAGRAAGVLTQIAESKAGKYLAEQDKGRDAWSRLNHMTGGDTGTESDGSFTGWVKRLGRGMDTAVKSLPAGGDQASWLLRGVPNWGSKLAGEGEYDFYSGAGVNKTGAGDSKAANDVLRQLMITMGPKTGVGSGAASIWSRTQAAGLSMTPFEQKNLLLLQESVNLLKKSTMEIPGFGRLKPKEGE